MILLLLILLAAVSALAGLVGLWQRRDWVLLRASIIGLALLGVCAFTADIWFDWLGLSGGDGQIFIGYYLFGAGAFGIAALVLVAIPVVLALRPKTGKQA